MTHRPLCATRFTSVERLLRALPCSGAALLACVFVLPACGQMHRTTAPERVTRAVGVYEWTGDLDKPKAARLVPVSLFINGHFEDAGLFLSRPVPFALQSGYLYEIDKAGRSEGTFSLGYARHIMPAQDPNTQATVAGIWYAYGKFIAPKPEPKSPVLKASAQTPAIISSTDSDKPHFTNRSSDSSANSKTSTSSDKTSSTSSDDTPQLKRPNSTTDSSGKSSTDSTSTTNKDDDIDRPTLRKRDPSQDAQRQKSVKAGQSGVSGPEVSLNEDPDRPTLRHGAPPGAADTAELTGLPADLHQVAAVSDAANRDPHIFAREWESPTERADTLAKLEVLARTRIAAYLTANRLTYAPPAPAANMITATAASAPVPAPGSPATADDQAEPPTLQRGVPKNYQKPTPVPPAPAAKTSTSTAVAKPKPGKTSLPRKPGPIAPLTLTDEQLTPYTLSYGGLPTFVYTAQTGLAAGGPVYLTLVVQRLVSGEFQVALSSVTDASHLDRSPWMRLVDAVDPDAGHRASLLFELRGQSSRQFALYSLTSAKAEQIFATDAM